MSNIVHQIFCHCWKCSYLFSSRFENKFHHFQQWIRGGKISDVRCLTSDVGLVPLPRFSTRAQRTFHHVISKNFKFLKKCSYNFCYVWCTLIIQTSTNARRTTVVVIRSVSTRSVTECASVRLDTYWVLTRRLAEVNTRLYCHNIPIFINTW